MCVCVCVITQKTVGEIDSFLASKAEDFFQLIQVTLIPSVFLSLLLLLFYQRERERERCPLSLFIFGNLKKILLT